MINVACVKFGTKYGSDYVNKLFYAVGRNLTLPFNFHCFTEHSKGIHKDVIVHPLQKHKHFEGWWHKLFMFSPDCPIKGRIFYLDLDTLVTGNLDQAVSHNTGFVVLHDFFKVRLPTRKDKWGTGKEAVGSGVLSWEAGKHTQIWETFVANPVRAVKSLSPHGDQKWIQQNQKERLYWQDLFPDQFVSFKVHCRNGLPRNARIVCYHGLPSIPDSINKTTKVQGYNISPTKWVTKYWNDDQNSSTDSIRTNEATSVENSTGENKSAGCINSETESSTTGTPETSGSIKTNEQASHRTAQTARQKEAERCEQLRVAAIRRNRRRI